MQQSLLLYWTTTQGIKFSRNLFSHYRISKQTFTYTPQTYKLTFQSDAENIYEAAYDYVDLISTEVSNNQLCLIIQHLLKVRHMPGFICWITVKALNNNNIKEIFSLDRVLVLKRRNKGSNSLSSIVRCWIMTGSGHWETVPAFFCLLFSSVLRHCWLGYRKGMWHAKTFNSLPPEVLFQNI